MRQSHKRAENDTEHVPDGKLKGISVHRGHRGGRFETVMEFVDSPVEQRVMDRSMGPVEPEIHYHYAERHFCDLLPPNPLVCLLVEARWVLFHDNEEWNEDQRRDEEQIAHRDADGLKPLPHGEVGSVPLRFVLKK